jgi:hypothetical protein
LKSWPFDPTFEPLRFPCHNSSMTAKRLKRPRDPVQLGKLIGDILTGQIEDIAAPDPKDEGKNPAAVELGRMGGLKGGRARADSMTPEQRKAIAQAAAKKRWAKKGLNRPR